jgi:hypothetical protein
MRRVITLGLLLGASVFINIVPAYAQRWGREATPRAGVCFYEDINYGGRYFCSPIGSTSSNVPAGINDRISSIRLFGNAAVTVFRDPSLRGQSRMVTSDLNDLRSLGFNDRISSFEVESYRNSSRAVPRYGNNVPYGADVPYGRVQQPNASNRWTYRSAEDMVRRSFRNVLGRDADPSGLQSWTQTVIDNNWTQQDLERALRQSREYREQDQQSRARRRF